MPKLPNITPDIIESYKREISKSSSPLTIKRKSISLNRFFDWAHKNGHIDSNPIVSEKKAEITNPYVIVKQTNYKKIGLRTFALLGATTGLVILIFLLLKNLKNAIQFVKTPAQETTIEVNKKVSTLPQKSSLPVASGSPLITANNALNGYWNLYASFKLTDENGGPTVGNQKVSFKIYKEENGGTPIYSVPEKTIETDANGNVLISLDSVPNDLFFENNHLYLEPEIEGSVSDSRIPVSTANVAANVGGYFPSLQASENNIPVIDADGSLVLASKSPAIKANAGNFLLEGQALTIKTADGTDGNIEINPDGKGYVHFLFEGTNKDFLNVQAPNLTKGSLYYGIVANNSTGYDLIKLQNGSKPVTRFSVDALGNTYMTGNALVRGQLSVNGIANSGNFVTNLDPGEYASISKAGTALSDVLTLTLDERGKPLTSNTDYSTLVLNRFDGNGAGAALKVANGNAIFNGQLQLGRYTSTPTGGIGQGSLVYNTSDNQVYVYNGTSWTALGSGSGIAFNDILSGTNTSATMLVGSGASLDYSGAGTINASTLNGISDSSFLRSDTSDNYTSGTLTTNAGTTLDIQGNLILNGNAGSSGQIMSSAGSGTPTWSNIVSLLTAGNDISITGTTNATVNNTSTLNSVTGRGSTTSNTITVGNLIDSGLIANKAVFSDASKQLTSTGTVGADQGGTGFSSYTIGDLLYADSGTTLAKLNDVATGNVLISGGIGAAPSWGKVTLGTHTSGNYVSTITGTANQITASGSTGDITLSLPNSIVTPGNISITGSVGSNLNPLTDSTYNLGTLAAKWNDIYGVNIYQNGNLVCDASGANCPISTNYWNLAQGAIYTNNNTADVLFGGNSTSSAKFAFTGVNSGTPTASISGTYLTSTGNLATTNMQHLNLGGSTTGQVNVNNNFRVTGTTQFGGITYSWPGTQSASYVLSTNGSGTLSWEDPAVLTGGSNYWNLSNGLIYPKNNTTDFVIGSDATASAKFAVTGVVSGTPTATISGTYLTSTGNLATTNMSHLTLGGSTTGGVDFNSPITSGTWNGSTIAVNYGGTGLSSYTVGDLIYASGTTTLSNLADVATGNVLISGGVGTAPSWGKVTLGTHTSGNYVSTITGTANQITASGSTGDITLSIPNTFVTPGDTTLGDATTDSITFTGRVSEDSDLLPIGTTGTNDLGSASLPWDNIYGVNIYQNGNLVCDASGTNCPAGYWDLAAGAVFPTSNSVDLLIGSNATTSAKFAFTGVSSGTPTASVSGTYLTSDGNLANTSMENITLGGATTGNVISSSPFIANSITTLNGNLTTTANAIFGNATTDTITFTGRVNSNITPSSNNTYDLGASGLRWNNIYGNNIYQNGNLVCDASGANCPAGYWAQTQGALTPLNSSVDLLIGSNSTQSAKFAFTGVNSGTPTASVSGTYLTSTGNLATTNMNHLTLGGSTTGQVDINNNLNATTGNGYLINNASVLNSTTLGSSVVNSSLTGVGALTSGSIASGFGSITTTNGITGGTLTSSGTTTFGGITYTWPGSQSSNYVLSTNGSGTLSWIDPQGSNYWDQALGSVFTKNNTVDVLFGSNSTSSAKFAFTGVNSGTPTASISGTYITADGNISNTSMRNVTLGGSTTGNVIADSPFQVNSLSASKGVFTDANKKLTSTGNLGVDQGGTGITSYAVGDLLYADTTASLAKLSDVATGKVLRSGGVGVAPAWGDAVLSIAGTANQITASGSTGDITLSVPSDFRAPGTLNAVNGIYTGTTAGTQRIDNSGNLTNIGTTQLNGITYTWPGSQSSNYVLATNGSGTLSWVDATSLTGGTNYWNLTNGTLYPQNNTADLLLGSNATSSAKFAFTGVNSGTPTASVSGTYLTADGLLTTTKMQHLTLGGSTTGQVDVNNDLNLASGKSYLINNVSVLNATTLGSSVVNSSLTGVGALTSGSIANGFGTISTSNSINGSTIGTNSVIRIDNSGNLTNIGNITASGTVNLTNLTASKVVFTDASKNLTSTGTVGTDQGGTGFSSYTIGDLLYADSTTTLAKLSDVATGNVLISGGIGAAPSWGKVTLGTHTSGNYVSTITGTTNQITASAGTGDITLSLPSSIVTPGDLSVTGKIGSNLLPLTDTTYDLGSSSFKWNNIYGVNIYQNGNSICDSSGNCSNIGAWTQGAGVIYTNNNTSDVLIGSNATSSAKFAFTGVNTGTPTASISGTFLTADGNLANTSMEHITIGGSTTGRVNVDNNLNLTTGNSYQINGVNILNATTLGSSVVNSSLTGVGALTSGSIASGFGSITTTNGITGGTLTSSGTTTFGGLTYTWPGSQSASYVLSTNGSGTLSWQDPSVLTGGSNYWDLSSGLLFPKNNSVDFVLGGNATSSAKFAVTGVNGSTPVATISGTYLTANGNLATTNMNHLTLGGSTTGQVDINNDLNLASGKSYLINNASVLNATTLGSSVVSSSLTSLGNLTSLTNNGDTVLGDAITDTITFNGRVTQDSDLLPIGTTGTNDLGSAVLPWDNLYATVITQNGNLVCDASGANCPAGASYWGLSSGALFPNNSSVDFLVGSNSTSSAKFAIVGVNTNSPTATLSGTYLTADGNLANTNMKHLTLGGSTTGQVDVNNNLNVSTGNGYLINNASVLNATTLGSSVVNSSLTSVGTLTSLSVAGTTTFGGITYTWPGSQSSNYVLSTNGSGTLSWQDPSVLTGGSNYWDLSNGLLFPKNNSTDFVLGSNATSSAKFAITGINSGTPTATISGTYLTADGNLANTNMEHLTLGGSTTGGVDFNSPITSGTWNGSTIGTIYGGTGLTSYTTGDLIYASNTNTLSNLADVATGNVLISGGIGAAPSWGKVTLGTHTSGNYVSTITGTANQITASASTGDVTLSIPSDFRAPGTLNAVNGIYTGATAGTQRIDASGNLTNIGTTQINGLTYTWPSSQSLGYVLQNNGSGTLSWVDPNVITAGTIYWNQANGALYSKNNTVDVLIGSDSTQSAKFAFTGVNDGTPTASVSGTYLTSTGILSNTAMKNLTLGSSTTGNVTLNSRGQNALIANGANLTAGGTLTFPSSNTLTGLPNFVQFGNGISVGGGTTYYFDSAGNINANAGTFAGDVAVNGADLTTTSTGTARLFNTNATTLNIGGAATSVTIGAASGSVTLGGNSTLYGGSGASSTLTLSSTSNATKGNIQFFDANSTIDSSGNFTLAGNATINGNTTLGNATSDTITYNGRVNSNVLPSADSTYDLGSSSFKWNNIYATNIYQNGNLVCDSAGTNCPIQFNLWNQVNGSLFANNNTVDLLIGGNATASAKFAITGVNGSSPVATISGTYLTSAGNLANTNMRDITLGGSTTGNVIANSPFTAATITNTGLTASKGVFTNANKTLTSTGTLGVDQGGTGISSYTIGDLIYASGATTLSNLADVATGNVLISGGIGAAPSWGKVTLGTHTSGNYVSTITGTANQITASGSTGDITLSIPNAFIVPDDLTVSNDTTLGNATSDTINFAGRVNSTINPSADNTYDLGSSSLKWANVYATSFIQNGNAVCDASGANCPSLYWNQASGALYNTNNTVDVLFGGNSTSSAKFAFTGMASGTPTASVSGTYLTSTGNLATTQMQHLTLGGPTTGQVDVNNDLNLASGKSYLINNASVLNTTTLGSSVVSSSLTGVGALTSGSIASGFGSITTANGITGGTLTSTGTTTFGGITYTWPGSQSSNFVLTSNGSGTLSWADPSALTGGSNYWNLSAGALFPKNNSTDFLLGSDSTSSAKFAVTGINSATPVATISGTYLTSAGNLATTQMQHLTLGGSTTGQVDVNNNLNLSTGNAFLINNASVLNSTTLGSSVVNSSLTGVGALTSGSIASGFGTVATANTITGTVLNGTTSINTGAGAGTVRIDASGNITSADLTVNGNTTLGDAITDTITFTGRVAQDSDLLPIGSTGTNDLGSASLPWDNVYATVLTQNGNTVCDSSGNCPGSTNYWNQAQGALFNTNNTVDLLIGSTATTSAKFAFTGVNSGTPTASISGTYITADGNIANTNMEHLTLGGNTTGQVDVSNDLNLASGKALLINNSSVLNATTLGSSVVNSSLTGVGALTSGSIASGFGTIATANTITGTVLNGTTSVNTGAGAGTVRIDVNGNVTANDLNSAGNTTLGDAITDNITFSGRVAQDSDLLPIGTTGTNDLGSASLPWDNVYATVLTQNGNAVCDASGANCPAGSGLWALNSGVIYPNSNSTDLLIGGSATSSAKFAFKNVLTGTPTASIAGTTANVATYLTGEGNLAVTNMANLTLGGSTTGNVAINSPILLPNSNTITGVSNYVQLSNGVSVGNGTTYYFDASGNINANIGTFAGDVAVNGGDLTTTQTTANLFTNASTLGVGASSGTTSINNNLAVTNNSAFGNSSSDLVTFNGRVNSDIIPQANNTYDLGTSSLKWKEIFATTFTQNGNAVCDISGNCGGYWQLNNKILSPAITSYDLTIGGTATGSAFQVFGIEKTSGNIAKLNSTTITTGSLFEATSSAITTGNILKLGTGGDGTNFSGNGILMDFDNTGGKSFTGNFLKLNNAGSTMLTADYAGNVVAQGKLYLSSSNPSTPTYIFLNKSGTLPSGTNYLTDFAGSFSADAAGSNLRNLHFATTGTGSNAFGDLSVADATVTNNLTSAAITAQVGFSMNNILNNTGSSTSTYGYRSYVSLTNSGSISNYYAFESRTPNLTSTGTIGNAYGFYSSSLGHANVTNAYGLYIANQANAVTGNYAIVTNAGNVVFNEGGDSSTDLRIEGDTNANLFFTDASADMIGINTAGPDRKVDILDATNPQLRLTQADGTIYADLRVDSNGDITFTPSGGQLILADTGTINVGGAANVAYNAFANAADTPASTSIITADNDLFVGGDFELKGGLYLTGRNIYNVVGGVSTGSIALATDPSALNNFNVLGYGGWLIQNNTNNGIATLMVDQVKGGDILSASASGVTKFTIDRSGNFIAAGDATISGGDITGANGAALDLGEATSGDITITGDLIAANTSFIGLGSAAGRIVFTDAATDEIEIQNANLDLNNNTIINIGNAGTDFDTSGGLTLAGTLTANGNLVLGDAITDTITFTARVAQDSDLLPIGTTGTNDLGSASLPWDNIYGVALTQNGNTVCDSSNNCSFATGTNLWQLNTKVVSPGNSTYDLAIGGTATASAKFQVLATTGDIITTGDLAVNGDTITSDSSMSISATGYLRIGDSGTPSTNGDDDDDLYVQGDIEIDGGTFLDGALTIGDASGDAVSVNSNSWTFANDTDFALSGGVNGLAFDTDTLSIDASNNRVGIGTTAPTTALDVVVNDATNTDITNVMTLTHSTSGTATGGSSDTQTVSLLHMDGADGSTVFTDDVGATWTRVADAQIDTAQSKFGGASGVFDGATDGDYDYITTPDSDAWQLDAGSNSTDWTIDFWARWNADPGTGLVGLVQQYQDDNNHWAVYLNNNVLTFQIRTSSTSTVTVSNAWNPAASTWYHVAIVKNNTNGYLMFIDGTQIGSTATDTDSMANYTGTLYVGYYDGVSTTGGINGWIDELRLSKGVARWTGTFTPPTSAYTYNTATGIGTGLLFRSEDGSGNLEDAVRISGTLITTTNGAEDSSIVFETREAGAALTRQMRLWNNGSLTIGGWITMNSTPDIAENVIVSDLSVESGDIVMIDENYQIPENSSIYNKFAAKKADSSNPASLIGVISTDPGIILNAPEDSVDTKGRSAQDERPLAIAGRVPVKVSTINGNIKVGDGITASELPGVGKKATQPGNIIGKALEPFTCSNEFEICEGKILVLVSVSWSDPNTYLTDNGDLKIVGQENNYKLAKTTNGVTEIINKIESLSDLLVANIKSGSISSNIAKTNIISPLVDSTDLIVKVGSEASPSGKFAIQNFQNEEVASIDNLGNATFAGTLKAQNIDEIEKLLAQIKFDQSVMDQYQDIATTSAIQNLYVTSQATINSLSIAQDLTTYKINSLSTPLEIQSLAMAPIEMMAGLITINTNGDVKINGNLYVAGKIETPKASIEDLSIKGLTIAASESNNASISAQIVNGSLTSNASAGKGVILSETNEITILNNKVTDYSLIYVTPTSNTQNNVLYIKNKENGKFVVGFTDNIETEVTFNWWIVENK